MMLKRTRMDLMIAWMALLITRLQLATMKKSRLQIRPLEICSLQNRRRMNVLL